MPHREPLWRKNVLHVLFANRAYLGEAVWNLRHGGRYARVSEGRVVKDDTAKARDQERRRRGLLKRRVIRNGEVHAVVIPHCHEPLVSEATFAAVQERLASNRRRSTPVRGGGEWKLTGLLRCGACGSPMHGVSDANSDGSVLHYYACSKARTQRACWAKKRVPQELLLREVVETIRERFADGPALEALRAEVARLADQGGAELETDRARLRSRVAELDAKIRQGYTNLALLPADMVPGVVAQVKQWDAERAQAAGDLERLGAAAVAREDLSERVNAAVGELRQLHRRIAKASPTETRAALGSVVSAVTVHFRWAKTTQAMEVSAVDVRMADALVSLFITC
jgi:hypothetical protein